MSRFIVPPVNEVMASPTLVLTNHPINLDCVVTMAQIDNNGLPAIRFDTASRHFLWYFNKGREDIRAKWYTALLEGHEPHNAY